MEKSLINEISVANIKQYQLLPDFIFKMVKNHNTSLGDNEAFPNVGDYPFDYSIIKDRFERVYKRLKSIKPYLEDGDRVDFSEDSLITELQKLITDCKKEEEPVKDALEMLAENAINRLFAIPESVVNFDFKLVNTVKFKNNPRITPESNDEAKYTFKDIADMQSSDKAINKRRFINSLIQGGSRRMLDLCLKSHEIIADDLDRINPNLIVLYKRILAINDYLIFTKEEELSDKKPMQGSYVETHLGSDGERTTIEAQGIIFPLLLQETIKGIFELFSAHGLPKDKGKAMYIIKKADYIFAEPWDIRFGVELWNMIFKDVRDSNLIPYIFTSLIKLPTDEFNAAIKEVLAGTEKGKTIMSDLIDAANYDSDYQQFTNRINAKNVEKSVIADSYFTAAELDDLESDISDEEVIEEDGGDEVDYLSLIKSATVENIDFIEGEVGVVGNNCEQLILTIDGTEIPRHVVNLMVQLVKVRLSDYNFKRILQPHIIIAEEYQHNGLAPKIYTKMVYEFGAIYSGDGRRVNKEDIGKVFAKVSIDPKIDVYTIKNSYTNNGAGVDYLAVLKGSGILDENRKGKKVFINESSVKLLLEDKRETQADERCAEYLKGYFGNNIIAINKYINYFKDKFYTSRGLKESTMMRLAPLFCRLALEVGFKTVYQDGEKLERLKKIFNIIHELSETDKSLPSKINLNSTYQDLENRFGGVIDKQRQERLNNQNFKGSDYEIKGPLSFDEAHEIGKYSYSGLRLCYTTSISIWLNKYTNGDANTVYVALKPGFENKNLYPEVHDDGTTSDTASAYDKYGLSMIFVIVDPSGNLAYSNTRWNHQGKHRTSDVDQAFTEEELEQILGCDFRSTFKPYNPWKEVIDDIYYRYSMTSDFEQLNDIIEIEEPANKGEIAIVKITDNHGHYKYNYYDFDKNILLFPKLWFDKCGEFKGDTAPVKNNGITNRITSDGKILSPKETWEMMANEIDNLIAEGIEALEKKYRIVDYDGRYLTIANRRRKYNIIDTQEKRLISRYIWFDNISPINNKNLNALPVIVTEYGLGNNFLTTEGNILLPNDWFNGNPIILDDFLIIRRVSDNSVRRFKLSGEKHTDADLTVCFERVVATEGYDNIITNQVGTLGKNDVDGANLLKVYFGQKYNLLNNGEIVSKNLWFDNIGDNIKENAIWVSLNNKENVLKLDGTLVSPRTWFDSVGFIDNRETYENVSSGFFTGKIKDKLNIFRMDGSQVSKDLWFNYISPLYNNKLWVVEVLDLKEMGHVEGGGDLPIWEGKYNFLTIDGQIKYDTWFDYIDDTLDSGFFHVRLNNKIKLANINGDFITDVWLDGVDYFYNGFARIISDNKWNFIRKDGTLLRDKPIEEWFDGVNNFRTDGTADVILNGRTITIDVNGNDVRGNFGE